jgi:hypothetical protein
LGDGGESGYNCLIMLVSEEPENELRFSAVKLPLKFWYLVPVFVLDNVVLSEGFSPLTRRGTTARREGIKIFLAPPELSP